MNRERTRRGAATNAEKPHDKRIFVSDGIAAGNATLVAECGRVAAVAPLAELSKDLLALTDAVCLNHSDADNIAQPRRRLRFLSVHGKKC